MVLAAVSCRLWVARSIVFARSDDVENMPIQLQVAHCDGKGYADIAPWTLSFNTADGATLGPVLDVSRPNELLVTGSAPSPKAGKLDIYRVLAPKRHGKAGCLPPPPKGTSSGL